jgi:hypothetical protein
MPHEGFCRFSSCFCCDFVSRLDNSVLSSFPVISVLILSYLIWSLLSSRSWLSGFLSSAPLATGLSSQFSLYLISLISPCLVSDCLLSSHADWLVPRASWTPCWLSGSDSNQSHIATDNQAVSNSRCRAPSGAHDQIFITVWQLYSCFYGAPSLRKARVFYICCWHLPAQSFSGSSPLGLATIFYCLRFDSLTPTARRVTVEVFDPASTRVWLWLSLSTLLKWIFAYCQVNSFSKNISLFSTQRSLAYPLLRELNNSVSVF